MENLKKESCYYVEDDVDAVLFDSAEEAWFWFCLYDIRTGYKVNTSGRKIVRPCFLDDIYIAVSRLYLAKKISERHLKTLIKYGKMQIAPDERIFEERDEALWWSDAMDKLETLLRQRGIVKCNQKK